MANRFVSNPISYHGKGAIQEIPGIIAAKGFKKAFVASDPDLVKFGVTKKVTDLLDAAGMAYEIYSDIKPNRTHALPVNGGSWKPLGPPGPARRFLVWYWRCSGGGPASAGRSPVAGLAAQVQHAPRREVRPVGPTCRAERKGGEAQGS